MIKRRFKMIPVMAVIILALGGTVHGGPCADDDSPPELRITTPTSSGYYFTTNGELDLEGEAGDNTAVAMVSWSNDDGDDGRAASNTDWGGALHWEVRGISLREGENVITVTAVDANGNRTEKVIVADYQTSSPPPPSSGLEDPDNGNAEFTFFWGTAHGGLCADDDSPPELRITTPTSTGYYIATSGELALGGEVEDDTGVAVVSWSNDDGDSGRAMSNTDLTGALHWEVQGIALREGENVITVTAVDANGNRTEKVIVADYQTSSPPPPPSGLEVLDNRKAKFTFFFGGEDNDGIDRFSIAGYLENEPGRPFEMPFNKEVTITASVTDPMDESHRLQIYQQVVPPGSVATSSKYTYLGMGIGKGIRRLIFMATSSTITYVYVFVEKTDFLPAIKANMSPEDYHNYVRRITGYQFRVRIGDRVWQGESPLTPWAFSKHKQELVHNR